MWSTTQPLGTPPAGTYSWSTAPYNSTRTHSSCSTHVRVRNQQRDRAAGRPPKHRDRPGAHSDRCTHPNSSTANGEPESPTPTRHQPRSDGRRRRSLTPADSHPKRPWSESSTDAMNPGPMTLSAAHPRDRSADEACARHCTRWRRAQQLCQRLPELVTVSPGTSSGPNGPAALTTSVVYIGLRRKENIVQVRAHSRPITASKPRGGRSPSAKSEVSACP